MFYWAQGTLPSHVSPWRISSSLLFPSVSLCLPQGHTATSGIHGFFQASSAFRWHGMTFPRTGTLNKANCSSGPSSQSYFNTRATHVTEICVQESTHTVMNVLLLNSCPDLPTGGTCEPSPTPGSCTQKLQPQTYKNRSNRENFVGLVNSRS